MSDCGKRIEVFGSSKVETMGEKYGIKVLGRIPDQTWLNLATRGKSKSMKVYLYLIT